MANGTEAGRAGAQGKAVAGGVVYQSCRGAGEPLRRGIWHVIGAHAQPLRLALTTVCGFFLLAGCETRETVDTEIYIAELETEVSQLEGELNAAYLEVSRLSGLLTSQVTGLEGSVNDLNLRVLDLPAAADPAMAVREVEAAVAVIQQRVADLKGTSSTLAAYLQ